MHIRYNIYKKIQPIVIQCEVRKSFESDRLASRSSLRLVTALLPSEFTSSVRFAHRLIVLWNRAYFASAAMQ